VSQPCVSPAGRGVIREGREVMTGRVPRTGPGGRRHFGPPGVAPTVARLAAGGERSPRIRNHSSRPVSEGQTYNRPGGTLYIYILSARARVYHKVGPKASPAAGAGGGHLVATLTVFICARARIPHDLNHRKGLASSGGHNFATAKPVRPIYTNHWYIYLAYPAQPTQNFLRYQTEAIHVGGSPHLAAGRNPGSGAQNPAPTARVGVSRELSCGIRARTRAYTRDCARAVVSCQSKAS